MLKLCALMVGYFYTMISIAFFLLVIVLRKRIRLALTLVKESSR